MKDRGLEAMRGVDEAGQPFVSLAIGLDGLLQQRRLLRPGIPWYFGGQGEFHRTHLLAFTRSIILSEITPSKQELLSHWGLVNRRWFAINYFRTPLVAYHCDAKFSHIEESFPVVPPQSG